MITKTIPIIRTRIFIRYAMKQGILFWVWQKVNGNSDNNMIKVSQCRESHCRKNTSIKNPRKSKRARDLSRTVNRLSKDNYNRVHQVYHFHLSRWVDWEDPGFELMYCIWQFGIQLRELAIWKDLTNKIVIQKNCRKKKS